MSEIKPEETQACEDVCCDGESVIEEETLNETDALHVKIAELEDKYLRANADFDNMKRRLEKEKMQAISYAHEVFARDLLPVIDALEMAIVASTNQEVESAELLSKLQEGIGLTMDQFKKAFEKNGIESVGIDQGFDPNFHEAMAQQESEGLVAGTIISEYQKGYTLQGRLLRAAKVIIAK